MNREKGKVDHWNGSEELHTALKSCREIGKTMTLYQFVLDIPEAAQRYHNQVRDFPEFTDFLKSVIICTEQNYNEEELKRVIALPFSMKTKLLDVLKKILVQLLKANKKNHL